MIIRIPTNLNKIKSSAALSLVVLLTACGGGGESGQQALVGGSGPVVVPTTTNGGRTVTGLASKSPIAGADVSLFEIDGFGNPLSTAVATGQTDDNGAFSLSVDSTADLLLKTSGGVFVDESDQEPDLALKRRITLGTDEGFLSLIRADNSTAAITPFTDILVRRAQSEAAETGGFSNKFDIVKSLIDEELGFDVLSTIPANPVDPATEATAAQMQYALFLGGFANALNNISLQLGEATPTFEIIQAVAKDLSDGDLDGKYFGDSIVIERGEQSSLALPSDIDFNQELARFRNNNFDAFSSTTLPQPSGASLSNAPPTANAGVDQTATDGAVVTLSGTQSADPEGGTLSFSWAQISTSPVVSLIGADTEAPSFVVETNSVTALTHIFELTVTDSVGFTSSDTVDIAINANAPPTANAGEDQSVNTGDAVTLSGSQSVDPESLALSFSWVQISETPTVSLVGADTETPSFVVETVTLIGLTHTFQLTVTDSAGSTSIDTVDVDIVANEAPVANAGADQTASDGDTVTLSGVESIDPEGLPLAFSWEKISASPAVILTGADTSTPSFVVEAGLFAGVTHRFELTVTDSVGTASTDTVDITINSTFSSSLFVISDSGKYKENGNPVDGGVKLDFDTDGTGQFFGDEGPAAFDWSETSTGSIIIDFSGIGGLIEDQYTEFGEDNGVDIGFDFGGVIGRSFGQGDSASEVEVTEKLNTIEFALLANGSGSGSERVTATLTVVVERFDVLAGVQLPDESVTEIEDVAVYDAAIHIPFSAPLAPRVLPTGAQTGTPSLFDDELYDDKLQFETDGTGFARFKNQAFDWSIEADGHLRLVFADGEIADYFNFNSLPDGDAIGVVYTKLNGDVISDGFLSVEHQILSVENQIVDLTLENSAGIYTVQETFDLDDGSIVDRNRLIRLYPNGTAQLERTAIDPSTGQRIPQYLPFGLCWEASGDQLTVITTFSDGINTRSEDCPAFLDQFTPFNRSNVSVHQIEGNTYRSQVAEEESVCLAGQVSASDCSITEVKNIFLSISSRTALTSTPVYAIADQAAAPDLISSFDIDVLANDEPGDSPIDSTTVVIETQPQFGSVAVDGDSGVITYTPSEDFPGDDVFFYRVSGTSGAESQSSYAPVIISVDAVSDAGVDVLARSGEQVVLDGTGSSALGPLAYSWVQSSGPTQSLTDPNSANPAFESIGFPVSETVLEFQLRVEDQDGNVDLDSVNVTLPAAIPTTFFAAEDLSLPTQFGIDVVNDGFTVSLNPDGTGFINQSSGSFLLDWSESPGSIILDFSRNNGGGIEKGSFTNSEDVDGITGEEEVLVTEFETGAQLFFELDEDGKDTVGVNVSSKEERFDVTNGVALDPVFASDEQTVAVYDLTFQVPFASLGGVSLSLPTDVSSAVPTLRDDRLPLEIDELIFSADGTGTARFKAEPFVWSIEVDGHLEVEFSGGDAASYFNLEEKNSGNFVGFLYRYAGGDVQAGSSLSFTNRGAPSFIEGSLAGIYSTAGSEGLNDGTLVSNEVRYIVNADNTGIVEIQNIDRDTGQTLGWFNSSFGICAQVIAGEMVWYRTRNLDGRFQGSRQPSASHCNSLTFADVSFARTHTLFEARENGDIAVIVANGENDCGSLPSQGTDCDANIINITSYFPTIFSFTPYDGQAPITVPDTGSIVNGETKSFDVLSNDIPGDSAIDLGSVEILVQPIGGVATIDSSTGEIIVSLDTIESMATVSYRVSDINGNESTISVLDIAVSLP